MFFARKQLRFPELDGSHRRQTIEICLLISSTSSRFYPLTKVTSDILQYLTKEMQLSACMKSSTNFKCCTCLIMEFHHHNIFALSYNPPQ